MTPLDESATRRAVADGRIPFVLSLARALHQSGHATHRLEAALESTTQELGLEAQYFATPTSIFASFGAEDAQRTFMLRTTPTPPNLGKLARTTEIAREVLRRKLTPAAGTARLEELEREPPAAPLALLAAFGLASAAAARFLGGGPAESAAAAVAGVVAGMVALLARKLPNVGRVFEPLAAMICSFGLAAVGAVWGGISVPIATIAGLIVLVPGLALTTAIAELANGHLSAGTARSAGAFMTFIGVGFGVALGNRLALVLFGAPPTAVVAPVPAWTNWLALLASAAAFIILLRARREDWAWVVLAGMIAFVATRLGSQLLGPDLGAFVGALAIGLASSAMNRLTERPSAVMLVPGLLTLVPGSIGFRSVTSLLESQTVAGIESAFTMVLTAVSLVAGLLAAAAVYPEAPLVETSHPTGAANPS